MVQYNKELKDKFHLYFLEINDNRTKKDDLCQIQDEDILKFCKKLFPKHNIVKIERTDDRAEIDLNDDVESAYSDTVCFELLPNEFNFEIGSLDNIFVGDQLKNDSEDLLKEAIQTLYANSKDDVKVYTGFYPIGVLDKIEKITDKKEREIAEKQLQEFFEVKIDQPEPNKE